MTATSRTLVNAPATLTLVTLDGDGEPAFPDPDTLTVTVVAGDGTVVLAALTAATMATDDDGHYSVALTAAQNNRLDLLTATWTNGVTSWTTTHEVCGAFFFTTTDLRNGQKTLEDLAKYPKEEIVRARVDVEDECEILTDQPMVPRYRRLVLDGSGTSRLPLGVGLLRRVRSVKIYTSPALTTLSSTLTAGQLAQLRLGDDGDITRTDGGTFPEGTTCVVEIEHGYDQVPGGVKRASYKRLRWHLNARKSGLPDRTTSYTTENGQTYRLARESEYSTGDDEVDAAYNRHSRRAGDGAAVSRTVVYSPQRDSLFHGGIR